MTTATPDNPNPGKPSRLEQEIDEILSRSHADQLKPPPRAKPRRTLRTIPGGKSRQRRWSLNRPQSGAYWMIGAIVLAILAVLVSDASPLLARLLVFAAVISFIMPIVSRYRGASAPPERKMWRGQVMEVSPPRTSPLDQLREWWNNRMRH